MMKCCVADVVELTKESLSSILENMLADQIEWLPYGELDKTADQRSLPAYNTKDQDLGVSIVFEARGTSQLAKVLDELITAEDSEAFEIQLAKQLGQANFEGQLESGLLQHLYCAQNCDGSSDSIFDYQTDMWLNSIENSWKGHSFHITKSVDAEGELFWTAVEQSTDVGW